MLRQCGGRAAVWKPAQTRGTTSVKAINSQLKSMKNIGKIVQTMKAVSFAKYTKAKKELTVARPYGDGTKVIYDKLSLETDEKAKRLLVAISSDRGLCGALHRNAISRVKVEFHKAPDDTEILCVGEKSRSMLQMKYKQHIFGVASKVGKKTPTFLDASLLADVVMRSDYHFTTGKVIYNRSISVISYRTVEIPIFSFDTVSAAPSLKKYEQSDERLKSYLEFSFVSILFFTLKEAAASEQASRVNAMDQATRNAKQMSEKLQLQLNKTRQAAITTTLNEIISGAIFSGK